LLRMRHGWSRPAWHGSVSSVPSVVSYLSRNDSIGSVVLARSASANPSSFARYGPRAGPRLAHSSSCRSICFAITSLPTESSRLSRAPFPSTSPDHSPQVFVPRPTSARRHWGESLDRQPGGPWQAPFQHALVADGHGLRSGHPRACLLRVFVSSCEPFPASSLTGSPNETPFFSYEATKPRRDPAGSAA